VAAGAGRDFRATTTGSKVTARPARCRPTRGRPELVVVERPAGEGDPGELRGRRGDDLWVPMADVELRVAGEAVQIPAAVAVADPRALALGHHHEQSPDRHSDRRTPARAGTTRGNPAGAVSIGENPGACGDDALRPHPAIQPGGEPPRVRGRLAPRGPVGHRPRRTPRACGDDDRPPPQGADGQGEPPRVRGRRDELDDRSCWWRRTPARAGATAASTTRSCRWPENPRACGDDCAMSSSSRWLSGEPPRVRGRHDACAASVADVRRTPARAGTTGRGRCVRCLSTENPRACGDDAISTWSTNRCWGEPPRVRGRHAGDAVDQQVERRTPARAGTTKASTPAGCWSSENPRACGDDSCCQRDFVSRPGEPPRVRGRQSLAGGDPLCEGRTPARAGTTGRSDPPSLP
jgi:hypothetical protein